MAAANPTAPGADSNGTDSCFPSWMILDDEAYVEDHDTASTTAVGETRSGLRVKVTFLAADPPRLSRFCVHCPGLKNPSYDLHGRPRVIHAVGDLALISIVHGYDYNPEYFFYRAAGRGRRPRIEPLPEIDSHLHGRTVSSVGFLPCGGGASAGYVVAAFVFALGNGKDDRELHVFRSERGTWTTTVLAHGRHKLVKVEKVIAMGDGKLGFVDLLKGILVCDVLSDSPTGRFIPLPKLLPANKADVDGEMCLARPFRDVAVYADGLIKCVEEEPLSRLTIHKVPRVTKRRVIPEKLPDDVSNTDELHDSDLMPDPVDVEEVDMEEEETYQYLGWRVITWSRTPSSTCWRKECLIHVDDIVANHSPTHGALLGELGAPSLTLKDLHISYPSLSTDDSNALYLTTRLMKPSRVKEEICVVKVDMGKKTLEEISPVLVERERYNLNYISCALSKYFNTDSDGTQVDGQNADSCSASSTLQSTQESGNQVIPVGTYNPPSSPHCYTIPASSYRPSTVYYPCYGSPSTPPASHPCFCNGYQPPPPLNIGNCGYNQLMRPPPPAPPTAARPSWPRPPPPPTAVRSSWPPPPLKPAGNQNIGKD